MNAKQIAEALAQRAEDVAPMLLPQGKRVGAEWRVGSIEGEPGLSLGVHLTGAKAGVWKDFAADKGGDLLDLWVAVRQLSFVQALDEARSYLGIEAHPAARIRPKVYPRPEAPPDRQKPKSKVRQWLHDRGLTDETIAAFRLGANRQDDAVLFPYIRDGELINVKTRSILDKRDTRQVRDAEPCLFGWHLVPDDTRSVCITEGEPDAMVMHQLGFHALSCNQGAGAHQWIEQDYDRLARFSDIVICYDDDEAGRKGSREVAQRLGFERCRLARFPGFKDANEALLGGFTPEQFREAIERAAAFDPELIARFDATMDEVLDRFEGKSSDALAPMFRFAGDDNEYFRIRRGEVTTVTGYTGHGKSQTLGQVMLEQVAQGEKFCIYSGEMTHRSLAYRMTRQAVGGAHPTPEFARRAIGWLADYIWVVNKLGPIKSGTLFESFAYAIRRYGASQVVIDSLMMLEDVPEEGKGALERQRRFMGEVAEFAKTHNVHAWVVAHPRKSTDERNAPGKQDVAGSGKIVALADNHLSIWAALRDREDPEYDPDDVDGYVELHKQRGGDVQHRKIFTWWNASAMQHARSSARRPRVYIPEDRPPEVRPARRERVDPDTGEVISVDPDDATTV